MAATSSSSQWKDVTSLMKDATTELGTSGFIMDDGFTLRDCMNALELGDAKMDTGIGSEASKVTAADELADGRLSLDLSSEELINLSDTLLRLQASWMDGNTVLQTVLACKFTHPPSLQSLRLSLGLPAYQVSSEDDVPSRANPVVPDPAAVPPHCRAMHSLALKTVPAVPAASAAVAAGSPQALRRLALLALATAASKTTDLARRVVFEGDIQEDEDYQGTRGGMDLVNTLTFDETMALLLDAEAALLASAAAGGLSAECTQAAGVDIPRAATAQEQQEGGTLPGGFTAEQAADALSKGTGLLAESVVSAPLESGATSPPPITLPDGKSVQCTSWHGHVQKLHQLLAPASAAELQTKSDESIRSLTVLALQVGWRPAAASTDTPDLTVTGTAAGSAPAPPTDMVQLLESGVTPPGLGLLRQYVDMPAEEAAAMERARLVGSADHATAPVPTWQPLAEGAPAIKALLARVRHARFMLASYIHMHLGLDAFYDCMGRGLPPLARAAAELQRITDTSPLVQAGEAATKDTPHGVPATVPGVDPTCLAHLLGAAPTRFKPYPSYHEALEALQLHLTHIGYIMSARLLVAATPQCLDLAAPGVTVPAVKGGKGGKLLTLEKLVALLAEGGLKGGFTSESGPGLPWASQEPAKWAAWSALREADGRPSVTLRGVADFQDMLVKGGANCVVRSMLHLLVLQQAPAVHSSDWVHPEGHPQAPSVIPDACTIGLCVMGTHSMDELVEAELRAAGVAEEYTSVPEARALVHQILPQVFLTTIRMHLCTPNRRRCTFSAVLRDWIYTLNECESLDQVICEYFIQSVSGVRIRDPKALDAVDGSDAAAAAAPVATGDLKTVPVPAEAASLLQKAKRQQGQTLAHWVRALMPATLNQHIQRASWLAAYWALRLAQDHVASSFEEGLLYQGELPAACLHMENFGKQLITIDDRQRVARTQLSVFRKRQAEADSAPAAGAGAAAAGGAGKKPKGKKGGKKGGKGGKKKAPAKAISEIEATGAPLLPPLASLPRAEAASLFMHEARSHAVFHRSLFTLLVGSIKARALNMGLGPYTTPKGRFIHRYRELFEPMSQSLFALAPVTLRDYQREVETVVRYPVQVAMQAAAGSAGDALRFSREAIDAIAKVAGGTSRDLHNVATAHDMLLQGLGQRQERISVLMQATESLLSAAHSALGEKDTFGKKADVTFSLVAAVEDKELAALRQEQAAKLEAEKAAKAEAEAAAAADSAEKGAAADASAPSEGTPASPPAPPSTVEEAAAARAARREEFQASYRSMRRRQIEAVKKLGAGPAALQLAVEVDALPGSSKAHPVTNRYQHLGLATPVVSLEPSGEKDWVPTSLT